MSAAPASGDSQATGPVRADGRAADALRPVTFDTAFPDAGHGAVLTSFGRTRVLCAASVEDSVPRWRRGLQAGWVTGEYAMLPSATSERTPRESVRGRISGRTHEIQRLIGRSLRSVVDLAALGERTITVDCDVLQADGGTRTAAVTGAWVALSRTLDRLLAEGAIEQRPVLGRLAAVSVGVVDAAALLDLDYSEDSRAGTDMNVVMTGEEHYVEVQGTAETAPFARSELSVLLDLAAKGCAELFELQRQAAAA